MPMQLEAFTALLGENITVYFGEQAVTLKVTEAKALTKSQDVQREPFSVLLEGPLEPLMEQGVYQLNLGVAGTEALFMVPLGPRGNGIEYEVVFN